MGDASSRGAHGGQAVHAIDGVPGFVRVTGGAATRVVPEDVDAAEAGHRLGYQPVDVLALRHIGDDAQRLDAALAQLRLGLAQPLLAARADRHAAALVGEAEGDRAADAAAAAGDDRYLIAQA